MTSNWNECPPEVLSLILEYTDYATITRCRDVSRVWRSIADHVMKKEVSWKKYFTDLGENGKFLLRKSQLPWKQLFVNYTLWNQFRKDVVFAGLFDFKATSETISKIHVYKDKLIVIHQSCVQYFNVENFEAEEMYEGIYLDFNESDHIFLQYFPDSTLALYGKLHERATINTDPDAFLYQENIYIYKLEDDICYIMEKAGVIWQCEWKNQKWVKIYLARYYGSVAANNIQVSKHDVFLVTCNMELFQVDFNSRQFVKANTAFLNAQLFPYTSETVGLTETGEHLLLVSNGPRQSVANVVFIDHGDMFIILEKPIAMIKIFSKEQMYTNENSEPRLKFNHDKYIVAVDIHEGVNCHTLIYATERAISKRKLHYPKAMPYIKNLVKTGRL